MDFYLEPQAGLVGECGLRAGVVVPTAKPWLKLDAGGSLWSSGTAALDLVPLLRFEARGWRVEVGVGGAVMLNQDPARNGSDLLFTEVVRVGWEGPTWLVGLRFHHYSNAGLAKPNRSHDYVGMAVAYRWK